MLKASTTRFGLSARGVVAPAVSRVVARQASSSTTAAQSHPRKRDFLRGLLGTYIVGASTGIWGAQRNVATAATMSEIEKVGGSALGRACSTYHLIKR